MVSEQIEFKSNNRLQSIWLKNKAVQHANAIQNGPDNKSMTIVINKIKKGPDMVDFYH